MNGYKKIFKSQRMRFSILSFLRFVPDSLMLHLQYRIKLKRKLHLKHPERYTEKIQWYKINYQDPTMTRCVDKYYVRDYVREKGLEWTLNQLYFATDSPDKIDFTLLPDKFALKVTNGSETNVFCKDKSLLDVQKTKQKLKEYLSMGKVSAGREWAYKGSSKLIIAEKYLEDEKNADGSISDYKFMCFDGEPKFVIFDCDRFTGHKRNIYDLNWEDLQIETDCPRIEKRIEKPENFEKMVEVARILSSDFPAVRVDLYNINGNIVFGELTFYPWSGYVQFAPDSFDYELGQLFRLPKKQKAKRSRR